MTRRIGSDLASAIAGLHDNRTAPGGRSQLGEEGGQPVDADSCHGRAADHREDEPVCHTGRKRVLEFFARRHLTVQVPLHQGVVTHDDSLDELLADLVLQVGQIVGDRSGGR